MSKTSGWVIIATEGNTVDGRKITASWINDMAELYSTDEYTAMVWPEHRRVYGYGDNWGTVDALKAEKKDDKLRLFAKLTPNQYLLDANKDGQKLFSSIEPEPDYKGEGRCYLLGLAVTDSPASTGTTRLKFSRKNGEEITLESDALEEIDLNSCFTRSERFFSMCKQFFQSGEQPEQPANSQSEDDKPMNNEQFTQMMGVITTINTKQGELEAKFNTFSAQSTDNSTEDTPEKAETPNESKTGLTPEQFSQLTEKLDGIATQQGELETKFNQLSSEQPGQRPDGSGTGNNTVEAL